MEKQDKLEEIEVRLKNLELVIQIAEQEICLLLEEKKELEQYRPVGFTYNKKDDKRSNPTNKG